jgi:hypothetical protein
MDEVTPVYRHSQTGWATIVGLVVGLVSQMVGSARAARAGKARPWLTAPFILLFAAVMALFSSLTVEVDERRVAVWFSAGLLRREFPLDEIERALAVTTPWWAGWGARLTTNGWLYSAWGRRAVELTLSGGRSFTIGSDEPDALLAAIEAAKGARAG